MFPPAFPLLIAAFSLLTHNVEMGGRLASAAMGSALVLPIFAIASDLYGRRSGFIAAIIAAFHPLLVNLSATVFCESTSITLILAGVHWSQRCLREPTRRNFLLAGLSYGLAYLTRPEAILYPFIVVLLVMGYVGLTQRRRVWRTAWLSCLLLGGFVVLAAPYVAWLSHETGQFRIEGKGPENYAMAWGIASGGGMDELLYGIDQDLGQLGIAITPSISTIKSTHVSLGGLIRVAVAASKQSLPVLLQRTASSFSFGSPILFALAILGLFKSPWQPKMIASQLLLFMPLGVTALSLSSLSSVWMNGICSSFFPS